MATRVNSYRIAPQDWMRIREWLELEQITYRRMWPYDLLTRDILDAMREPTMEKAFAAFLARLQDQTDYLIIDDANGAARFEAAWRVAG